MRERNVEKFFAYARAREQIRLDREAGRPRPWTEDKILQRNRFCNVHREDDKVTRWFRDNVRHRLRDRPEVLLATVVFRMFNRIETGEAIFRDDDLIDGSSAFDSFLRTGNTYDMKRAIVRRQGSGPYVTGSYIISTPPGKSKLDGVLWILREFWKNKKSGHRNERFLPMDWREAASVMLSNNDALLQASWDWLRSHAYLGPFHSYEIVTDLAETRLLESAPDIMTWCNPGPGARRGLRRICGGLDFRVDRGDMLPQMRELLRLSGQRRMWPWQDRPWIMRTVEHTLCEFDKYERLRLKQGRTKGKGDYA